MWLWVRKVVIYLLLLFYRRKLHEEFVQEITRKCRKRRHRKHMLGIKEELDEELYLPDDCIDDIYLAGFTKDGHTASFRIHRSKDNLETAHTGVEIPGIGRFVHIQTRPKDFGVGKLTLLMLEPMRRWKINFHGAMECSGPEGEKLTHVSLSLYWQCLSDPFDYWTSPSTWHLAGNLSSMSLNKHFWETITCVNQVWYEQWGEMWGRVEVDGFESQFVRFKSFRSRKIQRTRLKERSQLLSHHLVVEEGALYLTNGGMVEGKFCQRKHGYITFPVGESWETDQSSLATVNEKCSLSIRYPLNINGAGQSYDILKNETRSAGLTMTSAGLGTDLKFSKFTVNGKMAYGIQSDLSLTDESIVLHGEPFIQATLTQEERNNQLIVDLKATGSRNISLVGGKGYNLSILTEMGYSVPKGFCITSQMLKNHIKSNVTLHKAMEKVQQYSQMYNARSLSEICAEAVQLFSCTEICLAHKGCLEKVLKDTFGENFEAKFLAIRSSGINEDGSETSSAGQMDTCLGIKGLENVCESILKCWASSFAYRVVEYRRQNGQPLVEPMGVVVQEMVDADVAGVLFTNDPVTGDTTKMLINASLGLGETVVSGKTTPDTIKVRRGRQHESNEILEKLVGEKGMKAILTSTGIQEVQSDFSSTHKACLTDEMIVNICTVGIEIEERLGCPQDVEWAIADGRIHLLQTRPITTLREETDVELVHEFDTPIALDSECLTTCNVGEMFPGVGTPLAVNLFTKACSDGLALNMTIATGSRFPLYANRCMGICTNRPYISMTTTSLQSANGIINSKNNAENLLVGHSIDEHTMETLLTYKGRQESKFAAIKGFLEFGFRVAPTQCKMFAEWEKKSESFSVGKDAVSAFDLYDSIDENTNVYQNVWRQNICKTGVSQLHSAMIMAILRGKSTSLTKEGQADLAVLLSHCKNIYSADVPTAVNELANTIAGSSIRDQFLNSPDENGHALLMRSEEDIQAKYREFLKKHGHRCVKESEFIIKSWAEDPSKLMHALKLIIRSTASRSQLQKESDEWTNRELVENLKSPLSWFQKFLITNFLLDKAKAGVADREWGKSLTIKMADCFKKAYWRLADLMVREGYLPEQELMFFLTHSEIGQVLESRSASLVRKARRRKQILPLQEELRYPSIMFGRLLPLPDDQKGGGVASFTMKGMPVGRGVATGRACIVTSLDDADNIQKGDILICSFTDIGWSPYFSIISGLVTEMGGLMSHGAVVAREMGIPCVVGVENVTRLLKTGYRVKIHGLEGTVQKIT